MRRAGGESPPCEAGQLEAESIGLYLARQRALRGIGLEELAQLTRIPLRSLERLESGAFDASPDGFARGFVRTVAQAIGLDPDDAVARMLSEPPGRARGHVPDLRRVALVLIVLGAGLVASLGLWSAVRALVALRPSPPEVTELPVRRDAVRELAVSQGFVSADGESRVRPLAPVPDRVGPPEAPAPRRAGPLGSHAARPADPLAGHAAQPDPNAPDPAAPPFE